MPRSCVKVTGLYSYTLIPGSSAPPTASCTRDVLATFSTQLGYVPQDDIIHRDLTVERALYYAARLRLPGDFTEAQIKQRIDEVLDDVEISNRRKLLVSKLSGGQRKRVSIALELLANPSVFFLDEPTSGLDPGLDRKMMFLPYMFSKITVLGALCLLQSLVLVILVNLRAPFQHSTILPPVLEIYISLALTSLAGLMTGLALSALAPNTDRATSFIPIILIPQVIFSGIIFPLNNLGLQLLGAFFPARWAMAAMGSTIGLHGDKLGGDIFSYRERSSQRTARHKPQPISCSRGLP
jgi:ABC transporter/ABC-2 type transporter